MRSSLVFFPIAVAALVLQSCSFGSPVPVIGNGSSSAESRSVGAFDSVEVSGSGTLRVHKGDQAVTITADSNILPYITTSVSGTALKIGVKDFSNLQPSSALEYDVTLPSLAGVTLSGSCSGVVDAFSGPSFSASTSGSGNIAAELSYDSVSLSSSGSGNYSASMTTSSLSYSSSGSGSAVLTGTAAAARLSLSGSGYVDAKDLATANAALRISGTGSVKIRASASLDAILSGIGSVSYWGNPTVSARVGGIGSVAKAGD